MLELPFSKKFLGICHANQLAAEIKYQDLKATGGERRRSQNPDIKSAVFIKSGKVAVQDAYDIAKPNHK